MTLSFSVRALRVSACAVFLSAIFSCISVNQEMGKDYLAIDQQYDIFTESFPIEDIGMDIPDSLSSYSLYRFSFGSVRDSEYGLTTRSAAFTIVPVNDTLDFGIAGTQQFKSFHFAAPFDSTSFDATTQEFILQNVNVYELESSLDYTKANPEIKYKRKRITDGVPVFNGTDSLSFDFSQEFGEKYMQILQSDLDTITQYVQKFPGIYIDTDEPVGMGGRINMFKLPINVSDGVIYGSYASLQFSATYDDRGQIDTSFVFYLGPIQIYDMREVTSTSVSDYPQVAFNLCTHETQELAGRASELIYVEGGCGLKPVIRAEAIRNKLRNIIEANGSDIKDVTVSKATIELPFEFPEDYTRMRVYPSILSPTCRIVTDTSVTYAGLSDANVSSYENQGNVNRSICVYAPDVTHHIQEVINMDESENNISDYDIWLMPMHSEVISSSSSSSSSSSDLSDYYQSLAYASYYNNMYGGYGGYGGYGYSGYGYGSGSYYSNYYNMMMLASMYSSSSSSSEETSDMLDFHRYYRCTLNGPDNRTGRVPMFKITYVLPKKK